MDRLMPDTKGDGVTRADVVIEAIFENVEAKHSLFRALEPRMKPGALLATNTSSIPLDALSSVLKRPEGLVGLHFFNPVAKMQLIEIVCAENTDPEVAAHATRFARQIDRLPLPVKSSPGFLVNRILMPYLIEAVVAESEGVRAELIDRAALEFGMPMGPIELADTVGLDICLSVAEILSKNMNIAVPDRLRQLVEAKQLGRKTGRGFYVYKKGKPVKAKLDKGLFVSPDLPDRLIYSMLNESVACLRERVVESDDHLDAGIVYGTGFAPFRGGPIHYIRERGTSTVKERLEQLARDYGERFRPDQGWQEL
jgi:3-hydroxyacyl-CoA dehydrogenase/enoyl-CoA hydratase/3-hydroxybutyryl-CoA epimerase